VYPGLPPPLTPPHKGEGDKKKLMPTDGDIVDAIASGRLRLSFVWNGDRLSHSITDGVSALQSLDQTTCETPVYVELHRQGDLVFLSGHSGDRIWSASIEPAEGGFLFDVACRAKSLAEGLGIAYEGPNYFKVSPEADGAPAASIEGCQVLLIQPPVGTPPYTARCRYRITLSAPSATS
jgi:hypothetical protein